MTERDIPFRPIRDSLYTSAELSGGFDPNDPNSLVAMADFQTFRYFVINGRATPQHPYAGMMEALHDNSILQAMFAFLRGRKRIAAIMGGHREVRGTANFRSVAILSRRLSEAGFLMASGGKKPVEEALKQVHEALAIGMFVLLMLHVAAALKHQFVLRDDTLARMLPHRGRRAMIGKKE